MALVNIWTVAVVVDGLISAQNRLLRLNSELADANAELEASNEELSAREEEISSQNEELQRQAEELEQQMEESQQQAEELQQQTEELQQMQEESSGREQILQSLYELSTGLGGPEGGNPFDSICSSIVKAFGSPISAAILLELRDDALLIRGHCGIEKHDLSLDIPHPDPFAKLVVVEAKTACIEDLTNTPEIYAPLLGEERAVAVLVAPLRRGPRIVGAIAVYSDAARLWSDVDFQTVEWLAGQAALLLEAIKLQEELDRRSREAEDASRRKTRFLAAVSHDVRTPANAINLAAEVIQRAKVQPQFQADIPVMLEGLRSNAKQLVELVSDVLDISRLDSGKIDLDESVVDLCEVVRSDVERFGNLAASNGLELSCRTPAEPIWVPTDRMKLARVLGNLLGNAIKFTEKGSITVECLRTEYDAEIRVSDSGVGIPPNHLEHIFDEFFQVKNPERDRSKGTGLGLAICRRLIDALGFSISVRSGLGKGTVFTIRIPRDNLVDEPLPTDDDNAASVDGDSVLRGRRILLVEDHEWTRVAITQLLQGHGADIKAAIDAREALQAIDHYQPAVLLLDLMLPDMDGREILKRLQKHRPASLQCILAVSGDVTDHRIRELEELGADGMVPKPVDLSFLLKRIAEVLENRDSKENAGEIAKAVGK